MKNTLKTVIDSSFSQPWNMNIKRGTLISEMEVQFEILIKMYTATFASPFTRPLFHANLKAAYLTPLFRRVD